MFAKVKSMTFIDALKFELATQNTGCFKALLRDESGSICSMIETAQSWDNHELTWSGLNTLPYGVYTLELSQGDSEIKMRMVKRV